MTDRPAPERHQDGELRELARDLDYAAGLWRRRGLWALADALKIAAEVAEGWVGADDDGDDAA